MRHLPTKPDCCGRLWGRYSDDDTAKNEHICDLEAGHDASHLCKCGARLAEPREHRLIDVEEFMNAVSDAIMTAACNPDPDEGPLFPIGADVSIMSSITEQWIEVWVGQQTFKLTVDELD